MVHYYFSVPFLRIFGTLNVLCIFYETQFYQTFSVNFVMLNILSDTDVMQKDTQLEQPQLNQTMDKFREAPGAIAGVLLSRRILLWGFHTPRNL